MTYFLKTYKKHMAKAAILKDLIEDLGMSVYQFEKIIGASPSSISKAISRNSRITMDTIEKITGSIPNVSRNWLLTGMGEPLLHTPQEQPKYRKDTDSTGVSEHAVSYDNDRRKEAEQLVDEYLNLREHISQDAINIMVLKHEKDLNEIKKHLKLRG